MHGTDLRADLRVGKELLGGQGFETRRGRERRGNARTRTLRPQRLCVSTTDAIVHFIGRTGGECLARFPCRWVRAAGRCFASVLVRNQMHGTDLRVGKKRAVQWARF